MIFKLAAMHNGIKANGYVVTNSSSCAQVGSMYHSAILNVSVITDMYIVHIAPYHRVEPNRAIISHHYIAYNGAVHGNKTIVSPSGVFIFYGEDERHKR